MNKAGRRLMPRVMGILMAFVGVLSMQPGAALPAAASTADGSTALNLVNTVVHWHGTVLPGNSSGGAVNLRCLGANPTADDYAFTLTGLTQPFLDAHRVSLIIRIDWTPNVNQFSNDLNLTTYWTDAAAATDSSTIKDSGQVGTVSETTTYANPRNAAGAERWHAGACAGSNVSAQNYTGTATLLVLPLARTDNVSVGQQKVQGYDSTIESRDAAQRPNAGEPNLGASWESGKTMYMAGAQVSRITWNDRVTPPAPTWEDVTPTQSPANEDNILYTDPVTHRTWAVGLLVATSNINCTDDDGVTYMQCTAPVPHSPDHETLGSGPYPAGVTHGSYPRMVYYCSQNIAQAAGAFCGASTDGGMTYSPSVLIFGTGTPCGAIHGHVRVAPDGAAYIPQKQCGTGQGMAVTRDGGQTYSYAVVPDSSTAGGTSSDPSVAVGNKNTLYYAYSDSGRHLMVATSTDHGKTGSWAPSTDLSGALGLANAEFPEVIVGDDNRAAVSFVGSTTKGDDQASPSSCTGATTSQTCSPNANFFKGAWDLYVAYTYDRGATWQVTKVPGGPIQRGCVWLAGGGTPCRNMLDFNEITVDKQGRVLVSYTDGCTKVCKTSPTVDDSGCGTSENASIDSTPTCNFARQTAVARQYCGRGLFQAYDGQLDGGCFSATTNAFNPAVTAATGSALPDTATGLPQLPPPVGGLAALAALVPVAGAAVRRRRRQGRARS